MSKGYKPRSVLFVIGTLMLGGSESQMVLLIEGLARRGWRCDVAVLMPEGPLGARLAALGVPIHDLGYKVGVGRARRTVLLLRALFRLWRRALRLRPAVLHAYLPLTSFLGAFAGRLARVPLIVTSRRALGTHQDRHRLWKPFDRMAARLSHVVTANSRAVAEDAIARDGIRSRKLVLIANGIDFTSFDRADHDRAATRAALGLDSAAPAIAVVGNLIVYKGHADLVDAIARLAPRERPAQFLFVGEDRGIGSALQAQATRLGVSNRIIWLGAREDVPQIMKAVDGFVMPSHEEGFSNALLEALAAALPVVATEVGGNGEALEGGRFGKLVPPHNPAALARAIDAVLDELDDPGGSLRACAAAAACAVRARYGANRMVTAHVALYDGRRTSIPGRAPSRCRMP